MTQWQTSTGLTGYQEALAAMQTRVAHIAAGHASELIWLLEHPPLYTAGTSAKETDLLDASRFPIFETGRGGEYTYHGPGQRIAYVMLDLNQRGRDVRAYVKQLERWIILTLAQFGVEGFTREGRIGVWVDVKVATHNLREAQNSHEPAKAADPNLLRPQGSKNLAEKKIAALGIRLRKWVTFHGIAINVHTDLSHFDGIVPCGIRDYGVTSLEALGVSASMDEVDRALKHAFGEVFGPTQDR